MGDMVGCSRRTIQAIELGKLALSAKLAGKIQAQTGVDPTWLAKGDVEHPILDCDGRAYDIDKFAEVQFQGKSVLLDTNVLACLFSTLGRSIVDLMSTMACAYESGKFVPWVFAVTTQLEELRKRFGASEELAPLVEEIVLPQSTREKPDFQVLFDRFFEIARRQRRRQRRIKAITRGRRRQQLPTKRSVNEDSGAGPRYGSAALHETKQTELK
jgi:transcriptional regulator with XRE-family HTH domain